MDLESVRQQNQPSLLCQRPGRGRRKEVEVQSKCSPPVKQSRRHPLSWVNQRRKRQPTGSDRSHRLGTNLARLRRTGQCHLLPLSWELTNGNRHCKAVHHHPGILLLQDRMIKDQHIIVNVELDHEARID